MTDPNSPWINPAHQARSRDKRDRLLAAAAELIEQRGFEATRIRDIAARAGCSVGTFYHRFPDKAALFQALQEAFRDNARQQTDDLLNPGRWAERPLAEAIDALVVYLVNGLRTRRGFVLAALRQRMAEPATWTAMRDTATHIARRFGALCATRPGAIDHPDPALAGSFAVQMTLGTVINTILNQPEPMRIDDPALERELGRMIRGYLGVRE